LQVARVTIIMSDEEELSLDCVTTMKSGDELSSRIMSSALPLEFLSPGFGQSSLQIPKRRRDSSRYHALPIASLVRQRVERSLGATQRLPHTSNATPYFASPAFTSGDATPCSSELELERDYQASDWDVPVASHVRQVTARRPLETQRLPHTSNATPYFASPAFTSGDATPCSSELELGRDYQAPELAVPIACQVRRVSTRRPGETQRLPHASNATPDSRRNSNSFY
jgi:hypothetical protein